MEGEWERKVNDAHNVDLFKSVTEEEIKAAVWNIGADKAPGSDGFNAGFYRRKWETIKQDLFKAVKWFLEGGRMVC